MASESATKGDYGSIPQSENQRSVEEAEASEGPFPVPLKSMLLAEYFGTCIYVQLGCAIQAVELYTGVLSGWWQVGVGWTLSLTLGIFISAARSGGHLNPAISFAFALVRPADFQFRKVIPYWIAQLLGAITAGAINLFLFHYAINSYEEEHNITRGSPESIQSAAAFGDYYSLRKSWVRTENGVHAFFIEAFGTAVLGFVIFCVTHVRNPIPGAAIPPIVGIAFGSLVTTLGPLTGAGLNPARDFGPRLVTLMAHWGSASMVDCMPYLLGPIVGAPIGAFFADHVLMLE